MKVLLPLLAASAASAHTIFSSLEYKGKNFGVGQGVRVPSYNGPIEDVTSQSIACNGAPNPTTGSSLVIDVQAGDTVTAIWRYMLSTTGTAPNDIMDSSHKGPISAYLKKVNNAATDSGVGDGWFKIQETGLDANGEWGTTKVINGQGRHNIVIPQCIEPGHYLLRAEMLALHSAGSYPGAQFYQECAQINVIGGTGTKKPSTVALPGAYKVRTYRFPIFPIWSSEPLANCNSNYRPPTLVSPSASTGLLSPPTPSPAPVPSPAKGCQYIGEILERPWARSAP
jgi:lytic cellulose monooxygenase (C4-dehydrogenating)